MYVDVWNVIAKQERELNSIRKLRKLKLITPSLKVAFFMAYYKVSNIVLKTLLKTKIRLQAFLGESKKVSATMRQIPSTHPYPSFSSIWLAFQRQQIRLLF